MKTSISGVYGLVTQNCVTSIVRGWPQATTFRGTPLEFTFVTSAYAPVRATDWRLYGASVAPYRLTSGQIYWLAPVRFVRTSGLRAMAKGFLFPGRGKLFPVYLDGDQQTGWPLLGWRWVQYVSTGAPNPDGETGVSHGIAIADPSLSDPTKW